MSSPRRSRSTLIVIVLVATVALTATLAYEAQHAARSHRAAAENVLRDYAAFAAWELSRVGRQQVINTLQQEFARVKAASDKGVIDAAVNGPDACGECRNARGIRTVFSAPLPEARFTFGGSPATPEVQKVLNAAVSAGVRAPKEFTCPALQVIASGGAPVVVAWRPYHDSRETPVALAGFTADPAFVIHVFERVLKQHSLLPPSLTRNLARPNALLAVRVATPDGRQLFSSSNDWSDYFAEQQFTSDLGSLKLAVALRPDAAGRLIIGGLPRERLPLVVGLLALTAGLVVVALVQLRREAELSRLRSDFVSGVSHELRTPLAQIRMFSETLLLGRVRSENEGRRSLEIISREAQRLAQLVENVLLFSRGERKAPEISPRPARLAPLVTETVESFAPLAAARQARVTTDLDATASANVDAGALRQILLNLLDNAVKYGPSGQRVDVRLRLIEDRVRIEVSDEGPGIDPQDADRIWKPFIRLPNATTATGGAGIGLSIVRQLTELHGGHASVERTASGSRFVVEFPGAWRDESAATPAAVA